MYLVPTNLCVFLVTTMETRQERMKRICKQHTAQENEVENGEGYDT